MRYRWPADTAFTQHVLTVEQEDCALCQRALNICDHRFHRIFTLQGPLEIVCTLARCPDRACPAHAHTQSPLAEAQITLPWWLIGSFSKTLESCAAARVTSSYHRKYEG